MNFWQVAAGDRDRDYTSVFLQFGIMLVGPGDPGHFFEHKDYYKGPSGWRADTINFAEAAELGDIVILKMPHGMQWQIVAVGRITGEYEYSELFEDVEGWDLQHCRTVEWVCPQEKVYVKGLARGTFRKVYQQSPKDTAIQVLDRGKQIHSEVLPTSARQVSDERLVEDLVDSGLRPADAETVIRTILRVRRLARWYSAHGKDISEHETRTFLIVPVLQALGWSEQKMKVEWRNIDIAFFHHVYGAKDNPCIMILESKRMLEGLSYAEGQVQRYQKELPECSRLIVSDGICYRLYEKQDDRWKWVAYLNLLRLRDRHPYLVDIKGASEVFVSMMPK